MSGDAAASAVAPNARDARFRGARGRLTLRIVLLAILSAFGLGLAGLMVWLGLDRWSDYRLYSHQLRVEETRFALRDSLLAAEQAALDLAVLAYGGEPERDPGDDLARAAASLEATLGSLAAADLPGGADIAVAVAEKMARLGTIRAELASTPARDDRELAERAADLRALALDLRSLRMRILRAVGVPDVSMGVVHLFRNYALQVHDTIHANAAAYLSILTGLRTPSAAELTLLSRETTRSRFAAPTFIDLVDADPIMAGTTASDLVDFIESEYIPAEEAILQGIRAGAVSPDTVARWIAAVRQVDDLTRRMLAATDEAARRHLGERLAAEWRALVALLLVSGGVLVAYLLCAALIVRRVVGPLGEMRRTMLRLAEGDLRPVGVLRTPLADLLAMNDALRVFRINAVRRERLQQERLELHARIAAAARDMRADLEAAALVQLSQLPPPGHLGGFRFDTYFRASRLLGGDTFDFFRLSDGRVALFQVDVAGHGAAASLVSVAAHIALRRALDALGPEEGPAQAMEEVNRGWREDLPYFTALAAVLDGRTGEGSLVQAGHPYPVLLGSGAPPARLGEGGVPVGVVPEPGWRDIPFALRAGERLLVFSDGIYDVQDDTGSIFGEDRFMDLVGRLSALPSEDLIAGIEAALRNWSAADEMFDDISLVVVERV